MTDSGNVRVLCVDDSPGILRLLGKIVDDEPGMETAGSLNQADELAQAVDALSAEVVLLDLTMPGKNPLDALRELTQSRPDVHVIVFSAHDDPQLIRAATAAGARAFLMKDGSIDRILDAIRKVAAGTCVR